MFPNPFNLAMSKCKLPDDLVSEILSRLPAKTLIRFKCVCKPWIRLFSDPTFIKSHLTRVSLDPQNQSLIIHTRSTDDNKDLVTVVNIQTPWTQINHFPHSAELQLLGSINGIVCLSDRLYGRKFFLWNPATQRRKLIKFTGMERHRDDIYVGFGFHSVVSDFRILCIFPDKTKVKPVFTFYVYSSNGDFWNQIKPHFPHNITYMCSGVTVKGNPYWMGIIVDDDDNEIDEEEDNINAICVTFDVQREVFHSLPLPKSLPRYESYASACLTNLKDSLAYVEFSRCRTIPNKVVDVYVLDDKYGTWSKIYTVGPIPLNGGIVLPCFRNGEIVIEDCEGKLFLYNPISKAKKDLGIGNATKTLWSAFCHAESLVTI